jgi:hypothetical protein
MFWNRQITIHLVIYLWLTGKCVDQNLLHSPGSSLENGSIQYWDIFVLPPSQLPRCSAPLRLEMSIRRLTSLMVGGTSLFWSTNSPSLFSMYICEDENELSERGKIADNNVFGQVNDKKSGVESFIVFLTFPSKDTLRFSSSTECEICLLDPSSMSHPMISMHN